MCQLSPCIVVLEAIWQSTVGPCSGIEAGSIASDHSVPSLHQLILTQIAFVEGFVKRQFIVVRTGNDSSREEHGSVKAAVEDFG